MANTGYLDAEFTKIARDIQKFAADYDLKISNKALLRKAGKPAVSVMKRLAPKADKVVKRKGKTIQPGALKRSIKFLDLRRSKDVFAGPDAKIAPHAHLAEYGFIHHKSGQFVQGAHYVRDTYYHTANTIKENLKTEAIKVFEKLGVIYGK